MQSYKSLEKQVFRTGKYSLVPIRWEDRYDIMTWRNKQMYHLRQSEALTPGKQDIYFESVVAELFKQEKPGQILFSYLEGEKCIGYGGLVHINWIDKNAEISFIMNTELEKTLFDFHWEKFMYLIEEVAFKELELHKIFTYAFDIRPHLYTAIEKCGFQFEAELKEHCYFQNQFKSVKIHSKIQQKIEIRRAEKFDVEKTFYWANDVNIRAFSYSKQNIPLKEHQDWFFSRLASKNCEFYILMDNGNPAGSIRFDIEEEEIAKINYLIDPNFTGRGLGTLILEKGLEYLQKNRPLMRMVYGYVLGKNMASKRIFEKLDFRKTLENDNEVKYEKNLK